MKSSVDNRRLPFNLLLHYAPAGQQTASNVIIIDITGV